VGGHNWCYSVVGFSQVKNYKGVSGSIRPKLPSHTKVLKKKVLKKKRDFGKQKKRTTFLRRKSWEGGRVDATLCTSQEMKVQGAGKF